MGGITVYWFELLSRMLSDNRDLQILESSSAVQNLLRKRLLIDPDKIKLYRSDLFSRIYPLSINSNDSFVLHSSYYRYTKSQKAKVITTVHDFIQENTNPGLLNFNSIMKRKAINNSDVIIAISENTKYDILKFFPKVDESKIKVIYNGVSDDFFPMFLQDNFIHNSVLFVGSRAEYKNFSFVVRLVSKFKSLQLDIVGSELNNNELAFIDSLLPPSRWRLHTRVSNFQLNKLYNQSLCLLYPSSYEGFGIPIVEAMKAGCPVIALNKSSVPEISGESAILIDSLSCSEFYDAINLVIAQRDCFVNKGINNAKRFSWDRTFEQTLNLYN